MTAPADWLDSPEGQRLDRKSLRKVTGATANFPELAADCVCFANGAGGALLIGIEDGQSAPPPSQRIDAALVDTIRRRIGELTVQVHVEPEHKVHESGGEYLVLHIPRAVGVASTSDGRYFIRVGDSCRPVLGDEVLRLATDRPSVPWEPLTSLDVPESHADAGQVARLLGSLRDSERVKPSVKEKLDDELLRHYGLATGARLTNVGVLLVGSPADRRRLGSAPVVQAIRYDDRGAKIGKLVWDDHALSPIELIDAIWREVPDFRESYELPVGMFRTTVPAYEEAVVRELLVNALVHRPYTQRGDLYLNLHPDRLEVVNPGRLPFGVTPQNILRESRRRNDTLAKVFHDLGRMEREGSGIDLLYDRLLASGRDAPTIVEGSDSVHVTVPRRVLHPAVVRLLADADARFQLKQNERIALGILAQHDGLRAVEFAERLSLGDVGSLRAWVARLVTFGLVQQAGRTQATRYFVPPAILSSAGLEPRTTLSRVEPHRLAELIVEDLRRFPESGRGDIHRRIGTEIHVKAVSRAISELTKKGTLTSEGDGRWRRYSLAPSKGHAT